MVHGELFEVTVTYIYGVLLLLVFSIWGCQLAPVGAPTPAPTPQATPAPVQVQGLSWEVGHPERRDWSQRLVLLLKPQVGVFAGAKDIEVMCPGFKAFDANKQAVILAEMFVKISKFESSWNPNSTYQEPPPPKGPGTLSIGLWQMSYGDGNVCPSNKAGGDLFDPLVNADCAVSKAVALVKKDGVIAVAKLGMRRYWSVLRDGHHMTEIQAHVKGFCK